MTYMVAGYLIIWAASFALIFSMVRRQAGLQREIGALKEALREKEMGRQTGHLADWSAEDR